MATGHFDKAQATLPEAGSSPDPRAEIIRARIQAESGQVADAVQTLSALDNRFPHHAPAYLFKGVFQWDLGQPDEALLFFKKVLTLQKNNDLARSYQALCLCALGDRAAAADAWRFQGFNDNAMFRVRVAEYLESAWLHDQSFFTEVQPTELNHSAHASQRKALRQFYRRNFSEMLRFVPAPPTEEELPAFLAATAHEMLRHYSAAQSYIDPFLSRRSEWPDPLVALNARLMVRRGEIADAAREFAGVILMGPEDFGVNYYMGIVCLAYGKMTQARQYFLRAFTNYMVDTLEFQWWQIEQVLLHPTNELAHYQSAAASPGQ